MTYKYNAPGWQDYEERAEWTGGVWVQRYEVAQEYDKNGNRTRYDRNVQGGQTGTYGRSMDLSYTYGELNNPATVTDADDIYYAATFGVDGNLNITQVVETSGPYSTLYNYYDHDGLNRVTANRVKYYDGFDWQWIKRQHEYSATGAILRSTYKEWEDGDAEPSGDALLHSWGQDGRSVQNTNTAGNAFGSVWHWAGSGSTGNGPLKSPNADTASQDAYNVSAGGGAGTPVRRSFIDPTTEGDERNLWAQGMPNAKDSVAAWAAGTISAVTDLLGVEPPVESRFEFKGTVAPTDLSRATDAREKGRVGMFGSGYSYAGSSPRITSETIGRDINPLGRGDGQAYVGGMMRLGQIYPPLPNSTARVGQGNSVNNDIGSVGGPAGLYGPPDCGSGTMPGCCCNTIAADVDSHSEGTRPCNSDAVIAACNENGCDPEACLKAKCDVVKCLKETGRPYCTNCDCGNGESVTLPLKGGSCPGCGGGPEIPDTGDIFGAHFGPAGSGGGGGGMGGFGGGMLKPGGSIWDILGPMQASKGNAGCCSVPGSSGGRGANNWTPVSQMDPFDMCCELCSLQSPPRCQLCWCGKNGKMDYVRKQISLGYSISGFFMGLFGLVASLFIAAQAVTVVGWPLILFGLSLAAVMAIGYGIMNAGSEVMLQSLTNNSEYDCFQCILECLERMDGSKWLAYLGQLVGILTLGLSWFVPALFGFGISLVLPINPYERPRLRDPFIHMRGLG